MDRVTVGSRELKLELLCIDRLSDGAAELIRARIIAPGLEVERDVYEYSGYEALASYFEDLADSWRRWRGERRFASLEGDLDVAAVHDGHIRLSVRLRQRGPGDWKVSVQLTIDPGEDLAPPPVPYEHSSAVRQRLGRQQVRA